MSSIKLAPHASGTGEFTIAAPNSNTSRTFNLPDSSGTIATAESTLTQFNASGSAPVYACRAWVNFNGTGTVAIRASGNVTSITDNGTGDYTVNFTTAMPDANYSVNGFTVKASSVGRGGCFINYDVNHDNTGTVPTASSLRISNRVGSSPSSGDSVAIDSPYVSITIFR